jgi:poly [ADP-ribose] polymerase
MDPIKASSSEYEKLQEYITSTHGRTHTTIRSPTIQHAFRVERHGESEAWNNGGYDKLEDGERLLLWHGSRSTNFGGTSISTGCGCRSSRAWYIGILSQGLRIAPPEAPVTGYMFGKGVYFADVSRGARGATYRAADDVRFPPYNRPCPSRPTTATASTVPLLRLTFQCSSPHLPSASNGVGIMLLCEIAAKPFFEQVHANYYADNDCKKANAM